jgi:dihydroxy-acid dehydratase
MVGHISPEAMVGGPLSIVKDGDNVEIDLNKGIVDLQISDKEFSKRMQKIDTIDIRYQNGALAKYATLVQSASKGAITSPIIEQIKKQMPTN